MVRAWTPSARVWSEGPSFRSMISTRTPRRTSWLASINPVGPAPTISTSVSIQAPTVGQGDCQNDGTRLSKKCRKFQAAQFPAGSPDQIAALDHSIPVVPAQSEGGRAVRGLCSARHPVNQQSHHGRPAGLVRGAEAAAGVAVEMLVEKDMVSKSEVLLQALVR